MGTRRVLRRWLPHLLLIAGLVGAVALSGGWLRYLAWLALPFVGVHAIRRRAVDVLAAAAVLVLLSGLGAGIALRVDLGPALRRQAEAAGSRFVHRPLHIGKLGVDLWTGRFVLEDIAIEGLTPSSVPFFHARRVVVSLPWWKLISSRQLLLESVELVDWQMQVELFPDGHHSVPRFGWDESSAGRPLRFATTLRALHARQGTFTYVDHGDWRTVARSIDLRIANVAGEYRGFMSETAGTVAIKQFVPMRTDMRCAFRIDQGKVLLERLTLYTDGSQTEGTGEVDFRNWPAMIYRVRTKVGFPAMKEIFFTEDDFRLGGSGEFVGAFRVYKGGYDLKGDFTSNLALVNDLQFRDLRGSLAWLPDRFDVLHAQAAFYGGTTRFTYALAPIGGPTPMMARFEAWYDDVDLGLFTDMLEMRGLRLDGRATGHNVLEWPSGKWHEHRGEGIMTVRAPPGIAVLEATSPIAPEDGRPLPVPLGPEQDHRVLPRRMAIGGELTYRFGPETIEIGPSELATPLTHVAFEGRTAYGPDSHITFKVRTRDLQDADRLLAGGITAVGSPTSTIKIGGYAEITGVVLHRLSSPRVEGQFDGDHLRVWDVVWGQARGSFAVENSYADVTDALVTRDDGRIVVEGRFSLGYPRADGREEIDARVHLTRWSVADIRHAFGLDDYPIDGTATGEFHLYGRYTRPFGFGQATIVRGVAYGEAFEQASLPLRFEGTGVRLNAIEIQKGTGTVTGAAYVGWDGRYSFNAMGQRIPIETIDLFRYPEAPLTGLVQFSVSGAATFAHPAYDLRGRIDDLFIRDEGIGQVTARLQVRDELMSVEIEAASPRLAVSGAGRIARAKTADAELTFRFTNTSLDPYIRMFQAGLSPFTGMVASGSVRLVGQLANPTRLIMEATVDQLDLRLFDYHLRNEGQVRLALDREMVKLQQVRLVGEDTRLSVSGEVALAEDRIAVSVAGEANLAVLQAFFKDLRSSGRAALTGEVHGRMSSPLLSGFATITDGRLRHFSVPHSIDEVNGRISFSNGAIRFDDVSAVVGEGQVRLGGQIRMVGYRPSLLAVTVTGQGLRLRYPEGFRSVIDADLALVGTLDAPALTGSITVQSAVLRRRIDVDPVLLGISAAGTASPPSPGSGEAGFPLRFDVQVRAPSALRIESNIANIVSSADLTLRGTYDRPLLFGRAEIERGWAIFEGKRYVITRGTVDFSNPTRIEPVFDFEAQTRVRTPGQNYEVDLRLSGPTRSLSWELTSDPPLPRLQILSLLFTDLPNVQDADLRALRQDETLVPQQLLAQRFSQMAASSLTSPVSRVVEQTFGLDTFQVRPSVGMDPYQRLTATARLTFGKRLSDRVYLTFSRGLSTTSQDQIILIEYDQSDRLSWILSQNEDNTYALDVRVRYVR